MMRSMFSGVSGLRAHQLKMDVIGNNIANVNTVGFKGQRATFQEVFSQTIKGASSPQLGRGGTNPQQVGLGISLSSIDTFHIRGSAMRTDNPSDLAINGDGFFILSNSSDFLSRTYTRAGNFTLDEDGNLVASNGYRVLGYMEDEGKNPAPDGSTVLRGVMEGLVISKSKSFAAKATDKATMAGNLDNNLKRVPRFEDDGTTITDPADFIEVDDADKSLVFKGGVKPRETTSVFYDSLGGEHKVKFTFVRGVKNDGTEAGDNDWVVIVQNLEDKSFFDKDGNPVVIPSPYDPTVLPDIMLPIKFKPDGELLIGGADTIHELNLKMAGKNGAGPFDVDVNFEGLTQFANESTASITNKSGYKQGYLDTFSIGPSGEITGIFTNGQSRIIGQVALAGFKNPAGLEKIAENMYQVSSNSGEAIYGLPGSGGLGALNPGTLEMSNVDISREFTEMISTQRGFQANSRIITTSDEMLQELVNMKR
ncbi:flagellar hook protein FlgE [Lutispora saccharofermentans]|uniref:Flagellar hook protein FlgE n=1 Tax=Lutispora saccharofermentans TaxID=3024236 RepID=A0ABT1N9S3_9FIRM|nr:flagellar hook protein FlgE [Lutispora saccharofermentans]MCQ1527995.1 flagellar hook protein FlgE [Lutispora saccharofermentans]